MFEFDYPSLWLLLPAPVLVWWLLPEYRERQASVRVPFFEQLASAAGVRPTPRGVLLKRNFLQWLLAPVCWTLLLAALARPQLVEPPIEQVESMRDLMLAVDLSGSMDTRDMVDPAGEPIQRLDAVKLVLDDFIARREGDRIGVIVFGSQAFLQAPFTDDHDLVRSLLADTRPRMAGPQTMIGDAIGLTVRAFERSEAEDRLLVLLTDGNDTGSKVPLATAAEIAAKAGITVHAIAVGDPASSGEAQMDVAALREVARLTGGQAFRADDREALEGVYRAIDALAPVAVETQSYRPTRPLYHWPLGAVVVLLVGYQLIMASLAALQRLRGQDA